MTRFLSAGVALGLFALGAAVGVSPAVAFHDGGVAHCAGCHVTHNETGEVQEDLLIGGNSTDLCLSCHDTRNGNSWGTGLLAPGPIYGGGAFVFLLEDNLTDARDGDLPGLIRPGYEAGHNVISPDRGISADPEHSVSPGGTYPSNALTCTSCHDPHGRGGHYRLLYGSEHSDSRSTGYLFHYTAPAPKATGIDLHGSGESDVDHVAYASGMSAWCGVCHGRFHEEGGVTFEHVVDGSLGASIAQNYNAYDGTDAPRGTELDAYEPLVPFEDVTVTTGSTQGPTGASRLSCLSCHRAHASSAPDSGRWDFEIDTWAQEGMQSGSWPIPNPYAATSGPSQKQLCEKCHLEETTPSDPLDPAGSDPNSGGSYGRGVP